MTPIGIVTVSDRVSAGVYDDRGGPTVEEYLLRKLQPGWTPERRVVPDDRSEIETTIRDLARIGCPLVVTTGGTGPSPRDVTPDAIEAICDRIIPGFGERMRGAAPPTVPTAFLSRQLAGSIGTCLVLAVPGNPKAIDESLDAVFPGVPHCIELLGGARLELVDPVDPGHG